MTEQEIAVKLEGHEHEIKSLSHRAKDLEGEVKIIQDLTISVKELAMNMKNMIEEQKKQGERIAVLEREPAERWNSMKRTAFTAIVSTIAGALAVAVVQIIARFL